MGLLEWRYRSEILEKMCSAHVVYPERPPHPPRVLFLLHGLSDDDSVWSRRTQLETFLEERNVCVVMPDGGRSYYADAAEGPEYGIAIGAELPDMVATTFRVAEGPWNIAGNSMGGYGAFRIALADPNRWRRAHSFSGALDFADSDRRRCEPEFARVVGKDPEARNLSLLALKDRAKDVALSFDCGTEDPLLSVSREYRDALQNAGLPYRYREYPGDHDWTYWNRRLPELLDTWYPRS